MFGSQVSTDYTGAWVGLGVFVFALALSVVVGVWLDRELRRRGHD